MKITLALVLLLLSVSPRASAQAAAGSIPIPPKEAAPGQTVDQRVNETPNPIDNMDWVKEARKDAASGKLHNDISDEFREIAGDAFDSIQGMNAAKLKGLLFYEPALHDAERAISKAERKASRPDEKTLALKINVFKEGIEDYRLMATIDSLEGLDHQSHDVQIMQEAINVEANIITRLLKKPEGKRKKP